jgi:hypothetical protein
MGGVIVVPPIEVVEKVGPSGLSLQAEVPSCRKASWPGEREGEGDEEKRQ